MNTGFLGLGLLKFWHLLVVFFLGEVIGLFVGALIAAQSFNRTMERHRVEFHEKERPSGLY